MFNSGNRIVKTQQLYLNAEFFVVKLFLGKYLTSFTKTSDYVIIVLQGRPCKGRCPGIVAVILLGGWLFLQADKRGGDLYEYL